MMSVPVSLLYFPQRFQFRFFYSFFVSLILHGPTYFFLKRKISRKVCWWVEGGEAYLACTLRMKQGWLFCVFFEKKEKNWTGRGKAVFATVCTNFSQKYLFRLFCRLFFSLVFLGKNASQLVCSSFFFYMSHAALGRRPQKKISRHFCSRFPSFQYFLI